MTKYHLSCFFVLVCSLSSLTQVPNAQKLKQQFNISEVNPSAAGRIFSIAGDSPVRKQLEKRSELQPSFKKLAHLFENLTEYIEDRKNSNNSQICSLLDDEPWVVITGQLLQTRQIGNPTKACDSRLYLGTEISRGRIDKKFVETIRKTIVEGRHAIFQAISGIPQLEMLKRRDLKWQNGPVEIKGWSLKRERQTCTFDRAAAYIVNSTVYVIAEATNHHVDAMLLDPTRQLINEYIQSNLSSSLTMVHTKYDMSKEGGKGGNLTRGTTILERWSGTVNLATVGRITFDENPATRQAYRRNIVKVDLAGDAITGSNIALLVLPMVMSLLPSAIFADFASWAVVLYVIFTDVASAIPLLIKGVELIITSRKGIDDIVVDRSGDMQLGQIEIYAASCKGDTDFFGVGVIFVVVSIVVMIFGILLEIVVYRIMMRNRYKMSEDEYGIFGLSWYFIKSDIGVWRKIQDHEALYEFEQSRRYSEESAPDQERVTSKISANKGQW